MSKFLILEEPHKDRAIITNFGIVHAENEEKAVEKFEKNTYIDPNADELTVINLDEVEDDHHHFYDVKVEKSEGILKRLHLK